MPQGKVSRHLAILRQTNLMQDRRAGTWIYYSLNAAESAAARCLVKYLAEEKEKNTIAIRDRERLERLTESGQICSELREEGPCEGEVARKSVDKLREQIEDPVSLHG